MSASRYLQKKLMDHALGISSFSMPTSIYMSLFTVNPDDASQTELAVANGYSRVDVTGKFDAITLATGATANNAQIQIGPCATSPWGDVHGWGIHDASTSGNLLFWGLLVDSGGSEKTYNVIVSDTATFEVGTIVLSMD
jgi:hypothetical protein